MAVNVGTAEIAVVPDLKNFGTQASTGLKSATAGLTKAAGLLGVGLGAAFALNFGKEIVAAANETERSNKRLQSAAEDTSVDVQTLIDDFAELGLATAQDDEMLKDLASTLLRMGFKGSTAELEAEVQAITDLGAATSKGSNIITRFFVALNTGNVTKAISSAKTLGLVTQQQAENFLEMAKAGKEAEVVQKILTIAQTRAHGAAAEQATDIDILANKFEEFKEDLGTKLIETLDELLPIITQLSEVAFPALIETFADFGGVVVVAAEHVEKFIDIMPDWLTGAHDTGEAVSALAKDVEGLSTDNGILGEALSNLSLQIIDFRGETDHSAEMTRKWAEQIVNGELTMTALNRALSAGGHANEGLAEDTKQLVYAMGRAEIAAALEGGTVSELANAHVKAAVAAKAQKIAEEQLAGGLIGLRADAVAVADSQRTLNDLREAGKQNTREYRDAEADLLSNQLTLKSDLRDYNAALKEQGLTTDDVMRRTIAMGKSLGLTRAEIVKLFGPIDEYTTKLNNIPDEVVTNVRTDFSHQQLASGGVALGGTTLVGERGPELVELPRGAYVTPNDQLRRGQMGHAGGGGSGPVRIVGALTITDWRSGMAQLDAEMAWGDARR